MMVSASAGQAADETIEFLARELKGLARGEALFMERLGVPAADADMLALAALERAAEKYRDRIEMLRSA